MTITWTIIVLGAFLHDMAYAQSETTIPTASESHSTSNRIVVTNATVSTTVHKATNAQTTEAQTTSIPAGPTSQATHPPTSAPTTQSDPNNNQGSTALTSTSTLYMQSVSSAQVIPTGVDPNTSFSPTTQYTLTDSPKSVTQPHSSDQASTSNPDNLNTPTSTSERTTQRVSTEQTTAYSPAKQDRPTISDPATLANSTTELITSKPDITTDKKTTTGTTTQLLTTAKPNARSFVSQSLQTTIVPQSTTAPIKTSQPSDLRKNFTHPVYDLSSSSSSTERNIVRETCKKLGQNLKGNCSVEVEINNNQLIATITINANQAIPLENYNPPETNENENSNKEPVQDTIPDTLIAILASCGALVLILCGFAAYCTYHRRSYRKNQQHLTEELQTVENGYHDNPTLEVMEVQPEMQEKKLALNGEFNDSWIVPIDNLLKEDIPDEEDTHL
nr:novel protein similar to vertebrate podocalyxin-like (PODXL) [Danio rerio]